MCCLVDWKRVNCPVAGNLLVIVCFKVWSVANKITKFLLETTLVHYLGRRLWGEAAGTTHLGGDMRKGAPEQALGAIRENFG